MRKESPLLMGVMGCADIAWRTMIPAMLECKNIRLVAVASRTSEKARQFADRFHCEALVGYDRLLERQDIEALYVPLPTGLHNTWVKKSLQAEKHLLVEKSFAMNYASAQKMVQLAEAKELLIMENFLFPHHSQHQWVHDFLARGMLGDLHLFRSTFSFPPLSKDNFRYNPGLGGGSLFDAGAYVLKAATLFLGTDLDLCGATLSIDPEHGIDIYGDVMLKNSKGQVAQLSFGFDTFYQCHYELLGQKGKLSVPRAFTPPPSFRPLMKFEQQDREQIFTLPADNHYVNMLQYFTETLTASFDFTPHWNALLNQSRLIDLVRQEGLG